MKLKGWKRNENTGEIMAWVTTERPLLNIWITNTFKNYANDGLYEVNIDFGVPKTQVFKTKQEAIAKAYEIMKSYPSVFTKRDLDMIAENTNKNYHLENYLFIAEMINSPLVPDFKKMIQDSYTDDGVSSNKSYSYYQQLMKELKRKAPNQYDDVYSRL